MPASADPRIRRTAPEAYRNLVKRSYPKFKDETDRDKMIKDIKPSATQVANEVQLILDAQKVQVQRFPQKGFWQEWNRNHAPDIEDILKEIEEEQRFQYERMSPVMAEEINKDWDMTSEYLTPLPRLIDVKTYALCIGEPFTRMHAKWIQIWDPMFSDLSIEAMYIISKQYADRENRCKALGEDLYTKDLDNYLMQVSYSNKRLRIVMGQHNTVVTPNKYLTGVIGDWQDLLNPIGFLIGFSSEIDYIPIHMNPLQIVLRKILGGRIVDLRNTYDYRERTLATIFDNREHSMLAAYVLTQLTKGSKWEDLKYETKERVILDVIMWVHETPNNNWFGNSYVPQHITAICGIEKFSNFDEAGESFIATQTNWF